MVKKLLIGAGVVATGIVAVKKKEMVKSGATKAFSKVKEIKNLKKLLPGKKGA